MKNTLHRFDWSLICLGLDSEKQNILKELQKKSVIEDEEQRKRLLERLQSIYKKIAGYSDEKMEIIVKLASLDENFIRKLDQ